MYSKGKKMYKLVSDLEIIRRENGIEGLDEVVK